MLSVFLFGINMDQSLNICSHLFYLQGLVDFHFREDIISLWFLSSDQISKAVNMWVENTYLSARSKLNTHPLTVRPMSRKVPLIFRASLRTLLVVTIYGILNELGTLSKGATNLSFNFGAGGGGDGFHYVVTPTSYFLKLCCDNTNFYRDT